MRTRAHADRLAVVALGGLVAAGVTIGPARAQAQADSGLVSVWRGVFTTEQAARGEAVYREWCASCHGPGLEGADMTPPLVGDAFTANWNQLTAGDLFERIRTTMPLDRPGAVRGQPNTDLIAFILKSNGWPPGTAELPRDLPTLKQITIESTPPK